MIFVLTLRKEYHLAVEIGARVAEGKILYYAELVETGQISHFDHHADYVGDTIEGAIASIVAGLEAAFAILYGT